MRDERERLVELAGLISDGDAIDWERQETASLGRGIRGLRTLSQISEAFGATQEPRHAPTEILFRWGPLEILEKVGEGSFGEVFRAWDPQLNREVALKLGPAEGTPLPRSTLGEAQRLASVRHPNVLTVYGAAVHDGRAGIWTDLVRGRTLEERLAGEGTAGPGELLWVAGELCRALAAVHAAGLVHGDVKTANVVRERGGRLVLIDFGAARSPADGEPAVPQGTPSYLAPEVAAGGNASPSSDLYALGALLYRLATGRSWSAGSAPPLRDARPDLPPHLVATIETLLAPEPARRPASAGGAERLFMALQAGDDPVRPAGQRPARGLLMAWLGVFGALALVAGILLWSLREPASRTGVPEVSAALWGERDGTPVRLAEGGTVRPGDRLALRIEVREPTHVYVLNEDDRGDLFVLFPLPGLVPGNPLPAGSHRLPGTLDDRQQSWEVTSAGGRERFLVVASRQALPHLEQLQATLERARPGRPVERPTSQTDVGETLRGIGGLTSSPAAGASRLGAIRSDLLARTPAPVWMEIFELDNPG